MDYVDDDKWEDNAKTLEHMIEQDIQIYVEDVPDEGMKDLEKEKRKMK